MAGFYAGKKVQAVRFQTDRGWAYTALLPNGVRTQYGDGTPVNKHSAADLMEVLDGYMFEGAKVDRNIKEMQISEIM